MAHTSRHFEAYARRQRLPFLCVRGRGDTSSLPPGRLPGGEGVSTLELPRGRFSFALDKDLRYDPLFLRHVPAILRAVGAFAPDLIHITGPSDVGVAGALAAHHLRVPLFASWHTNVHEYAATRSQWLQRLLPLQGRPPLARAIEHVALGASAAFYRMARLLFAPNPELCTLLAAATGRPCRLMPRGVDAELFSPAHRTRHARDEAFVVGYVGRLSVEKNIQLLPAMARRLAALGLGRIRFLIVGQGAEEPALRAQLQDATFAGVLRGAALAQAYANMDCFVFPSHTDTFGNVVLEAMASGVPAIVTPDGGPAHLVADKVTGWIAADADFADAVAALALDPNRRRAMSAAARRYALGASWDAVFHGVYQGYADALCGGPMCTGQNEKEQPAGRSFLSNP